MLLLFLCFKIFTHAPSLFLSTSVFNLMAHLLKPFNVQLNTKALSDSILLLCSPNATQVEDLNLMNMRYYNRTVCQIWNPFIPDEKKNLECSSLQNTVTDTHHFLKMFKYFFFKLFFTKIQFQINFLFQLSS